MSRRIVANRLSASSLFLNIAVGFGLALGALLFAQLGKQSWNPNRGKAKVVYLFSVSQNSPTLLPLPGAMLVALSEHKEIIDRLEYSTRSLEQIEAGGRHMSIFAEHVSTGLLQVIGVRPQEGRLFANSSDSSSECVVGANLCRQLFSSTADAINRKITIGDRIYTVVGVLDQDFRPPLFMGSELFIAAKLPKQNKLSEMFGGFVAIAEVPEGTTMDALQSRLKTLNLQLPPPYSRIFEQRHLLALKMGFFPLSSEVGRLLLAYDSLIGIGLILMLLAVTNAMATIYVATSRYQSEIALRIFLGGSPNRALISALYPIIASICGAFLLAPIMAIIFASYLSGYPKFLAFWNAPPSLIHSRVLLVAPIASIFAVAFFFWAFSKRLSLTIRSLLSNSTKAGLGTSFPYKLGRSIFLAAVTVVAAVLTMFALLFLKSSVTLSNAESPIAKFPCYTFNAAYPGPPAGRSQSLQTLDSVRDSIVATDGVDDAAIAGDQIFRGFLPVPVSFDVKGNTDVVPVQVVTSTPNLFSVLGLSVLAGALPAQKGIVWNDTVVVSASLANRLGKQLALTDTTVRIQGFPHAFRILGVVPDIVTVRDTPRFQIFAPITEAPPIGQFELFIRPIGADAQQLQSALSRILEFSNSSLMITFDGSVQDTVRGLTSFERLVKSETLVTSILSIVLLTLGLILLIEEITFQMRQELAIRFALGSNRWHFLQLLFKHIYVWIALGALAGAFLAVFTLQYVAYLLFRPETYSYGCIVEGVALIGIIASATVTVPLRLASRFDTSLAFLIRQ